MSQAALEIENLSKTFAGTRALRNVDVSFQRNAVTALLGPNGCGKSTLIKILAGFHSPDSGSEIEIGGERASLPISAAEARQRGLRFLHQDLALVGELDVADNIGLVDRFSGRWSLSPLGRLKRRRRARDVLARFDLDIPPNTPTSQLSRTDQIMVAIARALSDESKATAENLIVVLDEPTASLPANSVDRVLDTVARIRGQGGTVIYVTHRIDEVLRIADSAIVLRDGQVAAQRRVSELTADDLSELIAGSEVKASVVREFKGGSNVLSVRGVNTNRLEDVSFNVAGGEILGVAGLAGCGRSELGRVVSGNVRPTSGAIFIDDLEVSLRNPSAAIDRGVAYVPPDRGKHGIIGDLSLADNLLLGDLSTVWRHGHIQRRRVRREADELIQRFEIRPPDRRRPIRFFSGGNQQKALIAKFLRLEPRVLVVDEPTQGVDIMGKQEIGRLLVDVAERGCAVLILSSDFDEIAELCDRVLVLDRGKVLGTFARGEIHEHEIALLASSHHKEEYEVT